MATTEILFYERHVSDWASAIGHYHSTSIDTLQTRFNQAFGNSNAELTSVKLRVKCYTQAKNAFGNNAHIDIAAYLCPSDDAFTGTRLMFHEDIAQIKSSETASDSKAGTYESNNLINYFYNLGSVTQDSGNLYRIKTSYPRMAVSFITDNVISRKMYCIEMKFIVEYQIKPKLTITLDANGGEVSNTSISNKLIGDSIGTLPTPTRQFYNFDYWMDSNNSQIYSTSPIYTNQTFYAHWTFKPIKIELDPYSSEGTVLELGAGTYALNDSVTIKGNNSLEHYDFIFWTFAGDINNRIYENPYTFILTEEFISTNYNYEHEEYIYICPYGWREAKTYTIKLEASPTEGGKVQFYTSDENNNPGLALSLTEMTQTYPASSRWIGASPNDNYTFLNWSDGVTDPLRLVEFDGNKTYIAYFQLNKINNLLIDSSFLSKILIDTQNIKEVYLDKIKLYG